MFPYLGRTVQLRHGSGVGCGERSLLGLSRNSLGAAGIMGKIVVEPGELLRRALGIQCQDTSAFAKHTTKFGPADHKWHKLSC
jgi:hypothetical protein